MYTRVLDVDGAPRLAFFARTDIRPGQARPPGLFLWLEYLHIQCGFQPYSHPETQQTLRSAATSRDDGVPAHSPVSCMSMPALTRRKVAQASSTAWYRSSPMTTLNLTLLIKHRAAQELTYDYRFKEEAGEDKMACGCGAPNCRGYLN